jgi:hypothetical protein
VEAGNRSRMMAWLTVIALACGFCYSIGFQSGWTEATVKADDRIHTLTQSLANLDGNRPDELSDDAHVACDANAKAW